MHGVKRCPPSACTRMPKPIHSLDLLLRVVLLRMRPQFHRTSCTQLATRFHAAVRKEREQECAREEIRACVKDRRPDGQKVSVCVCVRVFERERESERARERESVVCVRVCMQEDGQDKRNVMCRTTLSHRARTDKFVKHADKRRQAQPVQEYIFLHTSPCIFKSCQRIGGNQHLGLATQSALRLRQRVAERSKLAVMS